MAYVQANIIRLPYTLIHTLREKMIKRARLYQDILEELCVKERPTLAGPDISNMAETYRLCCLSHDTTMEILAGKGASGVSKTSDFKFRKSVEPQPQPAPAPTGQRRRPGRRP
jgi:hypothetical protein